MCGIAGYAQTDRHGPRRPPQLLDRGAAAMRDERLGLAVALHGTLCNAADLDPQLARAGLRRRSRRDAETVLLAYAAWGERCVERLDGAYAFVVHDERRRRLFGARDRAGRKRLYYLHAGGTFGFATESWTLLAHPAARREIEPKALARYLVFGHVPAPLAIYRGMRKLPRAHRFTLDLDDDRLSLEPCRPAPTPEPREPGRPAASRLEHLRRAVDEAVARRLADAASAGVLLSGDPAGSAVAAAAARWLGRNGVKTFALRYDEPGRRAPAAPPGADHHELRVEPEAALRVLDEVAASLDEPLADPAIVPAFLLARFARAHVTAALVPDGGDALFGAGSPRGERLARLLRGARIPPHERLWRRLGAFEPEAAGALMADGAAGDAALDSTFEPLRWLADVGGARDAAARDAELLAATRLADGVLAASDLAAAETGLDVRSPLLDSDVAEAAARVPARFRRRAFDALPRRAARDGTPPLSSWLRGPLRAVLREELSERAVADQGLLDPAAVARLTDEHLAGRRDHGRALFTLLVLHRWHRRASDAAPALRRAA